MLETNNLRIAQVERLMSPRELNQALPLSEAAAQVVATARREIEAVLSGRDPRLLVIVGPCSIHDPVAAREYAERMLELRARVRDDLLICMRAYFEKPRTTVGWKGLVNDPHLDGTQDIPTGLQTARRLLLDLAELGIPTATEMLDPIVPQYMADLISWSAIGARTTESQTHREMASGLSMPVGFKNGTDGSLAVAVNAMRAAREPHSFLGIDVDGRVSVVRTSGNPHCHVVLRGGTSGANYHADAVGGAATLLREAGLQSRVLIDASHANSGKDAQNQVQVVADVAGQVAAKSADILGVMIESHLVAGRQDLTGPVSSLRYGQSITDACVDFATTERMLVQLAQSHAATR